MTKRELQFTKEQEDAVRSMRRGRAQGSASKSTTSKEGSGIGCSTLTRWWASATTVTNSLDVTRRWRMTVDGC